MSDSVKMSPLHAAGEEWQVLEGTILMSRKERERLAVLVQVKSGKLKLVIAGAAMGGGLSAGQAGVAAVPATCAPTTRSRAGQAPRKSGRLGQAQNRRR